MTLHFSALAAMKERNTYGGGPPGKEDLSSQEVESRVRRLTAVASNLFWRGSYQTAFESLMKAYLLDPSSPYVIACEKTLLPVLDMMRERVLFPHSESSSGSSENLQIARRLADQMVRLGATADDASIQNTPSAPPVQPDPALQLQEQRIEFLKQKQEITKNQREKEMWRQASKPPSIVDPSATTKATDGSRLKDTTSESQKAPGGFLSRLKQGRQS
jgi:hypothetical protein